MYVRLLLSAITLVLFSEPGFSSSIPVILNHSDTAYAGDVIYLLGSEFGSTPYVQYSYNDSNWQALTVTSSANSVVLAKISPMELGLPDLMTIRVSANGSNWSKPVFINQAKAFSFDSDQIAPS